MKRRITIPEDHVAVVLPAQTADELMSLLRLIRQPHGRLLFGLDPKPLRAVAGDVMLALLEAKEG